MTPVRLVVGHRGVGKSTWIQRLSAAAAPMSSVRFLDLDHEIEKASGRSIANWLALGEPEFRRDEAETLARLCQTDTETDTETWISVGAGIERVPHEAYVLWLRRSTDGHGRVLLDRPRLDTHVSPYLEYMERWSVRERRFRSWAHEEVWLPEGYSGGLESLYLGAATDLPFDLTLHAGHFKNWPMSWERLKRWNIRRFEIRDDLLTDEQMALAGATIPAEKQLHSMRKSDRSHGDRSHKQTRLPTDWALELGPPPWPSEIVSLHTREATLAEDISRLMAHADSAIAKLAIEIHSFEELWWGHKWWREDPSRRAFLPRSQNGRWRWYRTVFGAQMPLHFFREGDGSALDQPYVWEALKSSRQADSFAAVLGSPIDHSRSPEEHRDFFKQKDMPFVAIDIADEEWAEAWPVVEKLGLRWAAVTAPLKKRAAEVAPGVQGEASVNTLWREGPCWRGENTDLIALKKIATELQPYSSAWVWGAGATSASVATAFSNVEIISARDGTERSDSPEVLIWATGRSRLFKWPPESCRPRLVLDLNYTGDSPGLEWAASRGVLYKSGLQMFKLQAEEQRKLWIP